MNGKACPTCSWLKDKPTRKRSRSRSPGRDRGRRHGERDRDEEGDRESRKEERMWEAVRALSFISLHEIFTDRMLRESRLERLSKKKDERKLSWEDGELVLRSEKELSGVTVETWDAATERWAGSDLPKRMLVYWETLWELRHTGVSLKELLRCDVACRERWSRRPLVEDRCAVWGTVDTDATTNAKTAAKPHLNLAGAARAAGAAGPAAAAPAGRVAGARSGRRKPRSERGEARAKSPDSPPPRATAKGGSKGTRGGDRAPAPAGESKEQKSSKDRCRFQDKPGGCTKGAACKWLHDASA